MLTDREKSDNLENPRRGGGGSAFEDLVRAEGDLLRLVVIAVCILVLMGILNPGKFLTLKNFTSMSFQFPELGIFALAIMLSLITGGIDLSVVSVANLAGILAALVLTRTTPVDATGGQTILWVVAGVVVAVSTGWLCGAMNGLLIARAGITPILATLGTMQLYMGLSLVLTRGAAVQGYPAPFLAIGNESVLALPAPLLIFVVLAILTSVLLRRTRFGTHLYLLGTNETAARFSGIDVKKTLLRTYMTTGVLAGIAGIVMIARTNSAKADYGSSYLLQAVLVAILGGVNPHGGSGAVSGLVIALLSLQFLSSGFNMLRFDILTLRFNIFMKEFAWGTLLLLVMVVNYLGRRRGPRPALPGGRGGARGRSGD